MIDRRTFFLGTAGAAVIAAAAACSTTSTPGQAGPTSAAAPGGGHIRGATAITEVFGDGQKLTAVAVEYDADIAAAGLAPTAFAVEGRTVTAAYASIDPTPGAHPHDGRYVIVELSPDDAGAALTSNSAAQSGPPGGAAPPSGHTGPPPGGGPPSGPMTQPAKAATATVTQAGPVTTTTGASYGPQAAVATSKVTNLVVDDFKQLQFTDPKTGQVVNYNLFTPKNYDPGKTYPLVLFMHDSSVLSTVTTTTLTQGLGAVCWASPQDQLRRPAFVLAPQYSTTVVDDHNGYTVTPMLDATVNLVNDITGRYSIDKNRLYATGQSMGAIMSIVMDIRYPGLFAASFIVAGQWDTTQVAPLATDKLWIVVSEGDTSAYPGENAITADLEKRGARVSRATWDGRSTPAQLDADARTLAAQRTPINYAAFVSGSVVPTGQTDNSLSNHLNTWRVAYTIDAIRAWTFEQHR